MKEYAKQLARRKSVRKYDESISVSAEEMRKIQKESNRKQAIDFSKMERDLALNLKEIQASKL